MGQGKEYAVEMQTQARRNASLPCITLTRVHRDGPVKYMTHASGYVMARRPGGIPFVMAEKQWRALPTKGDTE